MALDSAVACYVACGRLGIVSPCKIQRLLQWSWLWTLYRGLCCFRIPRHYESSPFGFRYRLPLHSLVAHSCFADPPEQIGAHSPKALQMIVSPAQCAPATRRNASPLSAGRQFGCAIRPPPGSPAAGDELDRCLTATAFASRTG